MALDITTLTIMRILPREVDPMVFNMLSEDPGAVAYNDIGGLVSFPFLSLLLNKFLISCP